MAQEVEPLVLVLLLGLVTDYSVFLMSAMRRELEKGEGVTAAARAAAARTVPVILAAGLIVAGGVAALVVGRLEFFQTFGPSLAITSLIALAVSITLIPAALALLGGRLFGGKMSASARAAETSGQGPPRRSAHPAPHRHAARSAPRPRGRYIAAEHALRAS